MANQLFKNFPELQYTLNTGKIVTIKDFFRKARVESAALDSLIEYQYYEILDGERPDVVASKLYGDGNLHWTFFLVNDFDNYYDWYMDFQTFSTYLDAKFPGQSLNAALTSDIIQPPTYDTSVITETNPTGWLYDNKFMIGETVTSTLGNTGTITRIEPTYKRIVVEGTDTFVTPEHPATETVTGNKSGKSFSINSVTEHRDSAHHYKDADGNRRNNGGDGWTAVSHFTEEYNDNEKKRKIKIIDPRKMISVLREFERIMSDDY